MKLTKEKLKKLIKEEFQAIVSEQEEVDQKIQDAKTAMEKEAKNILSQIEKLSESLEMSPEMLKGILVQYLNEK